MNAEKRTTRLIYALAAGTLLVVACVLGGMSLWSVGPTPAPSAEQPVDMAALHEEWSAAVISATQDLAADSPKGRFMAAKEALLGLRVASADRDAHAALVMALLALERGEPGAFAAWLAARASAGF